MHSHFELVDTAVGRVEIMRCGSEGPLCVVLPGGAGGIRMYESFCKRLASEGLLVIAVNPRGSGASKGPLENLTLHDFASDVAEVIEQFGAPAILVGHAGGNRVARTVATNRPDLILAAVLLAAGGKVSPDSEAMKAMAMSLKSSLSAGERRKYAAAALFAPGNIPPNDYPSPDRSAATAVAFSRAARRTPVEQWWAGGNVPLLVVQGKQDRIAPPANGYLLRDEFAHRVRVIDIDNAGHNLFLEQPDKVSEAVIQFLRNHGWL